MNIVKLEDFQFIILLRKAHICRILKGQHIPQYAYIMGCCHLIPKHGHGKMGLNYSCISSILEKDV